MEILYKRTMRGVSSVTESDRFSPPLRWKASCASLLTRKSHRGSLYSAEDSKEIRRSPHTPGAGFSSEIYPAADPSPDPVTIPCIRMCPRLHQRSISQRQRPAPHRKGKDPETRYPRLLRKPLFYPGVSACISGYFISAVRTGSAYQPVLPRQRSSSRSPHIPLHLQSGHEAL